MSTNTQSKLDVDSKIELKKVEMDLANNMIVMMSVLS